MSEPKASPELVALQQRKLRCKICGKKQFAHYPDPPDGYWPDCTTFVEDRPTIVCLCGSTRFYDAFQEANYARTMAGEIVLSVGFYPHAKAEHGHGEGVGHDSIEKVALDELHKRKIDLCDYVLVLDVGGYVGDSTHSEIAYAKAIGKPVRYLSRPCAACGEPMRADVDLTHQCPGSSAWSWTWRPRPFGDRQEASDV